MIDLLDRTKPADFEAHMYYADAGSIITYGCKNGEGFYTEEQEEVDILPDITELKKKLDEKRTRPQVL